MCRTASWSVLGLGLLAGTLLMARSQEDQVELRLALVGIPQTVSALEAMGVTVELANSDLGLIQARVPVPLLDAVAQLGAVQGIRLPDIGVTNRLLVTPPPNQQLPLPTDPKISSNVVAAVAQGQVEADGTIRVYISIVSLAQVLAALQAMGATVQIVNVDPPLLDVRTASDLRRAIDLWGAVRLVRLEKGSSGTPDTP